MCGINGLFLLNGRLPVDGEALVSAMNDRIRHRGPDDAGIWSDAQAGIWLGHRRLSIIDLSPAGHQPMKDDTGNQIVFNGEIYNYLELKRTFTGEHFHSGSDTEVLMKLYAKQQHACLPQLNGMFAFAWWNKREEKLYLARDRAGKKPLYYTTMNGVFAFSSELKALLSLPWVKAEPDDTALYHFLTFNQLNAPLTMFKGIQKLEPGSCLTVNRSGIIEQRSWTEVEYSDLRACSEEELAERTLSTLRQSIQYRMVADVPVGAFLSGGVDSSAVVALMREYSSQPIKTYSIGFDGQPDYDERRYAREIAKQFDTDHFEKVVRPEEIAEFLPEIVDIFDEPMADATCVPIYFISKLARENGTIVVQTGDGADELFAGYRGWMKYSAMYPWYHRYMLLPSFLRKGVAALAGGDQDASPVKEILHRAARGEEFFWGGAKAFKESTKRSFLQSSWQEKMHTTTSYSVIEKQRSAFAKLQLQHPWLNDSDWMCYLGYKQQIPWKYLYRMDKLGMRHSIEIRNPFLDYQMVNLALSIPSAMKVKNQEPKYILKKALEPVLSHEILYRKKMGFCVPLREWAGDVMLDYVEQHLHEFCSNTGIFDEVGLRKHVQEIKRGQSQYTNNLWTVYFLMAWFKRWMSA